MNSGIEIKWGIYWRKQVANHGHVRIDMLGLEWVCFIYLSPDICIFAVMYRIDECT